MSLFATKKDVAEMLGVSVGKVDTMIRNRRIPYFKIDKTVRFDLKEVKDSIYKQYHRP